MATLRRAAPVPSALLLILIAGVHGAGAQTPAAPPPPPPGWTGSLGAGLAITGGNTETSNLNLSYDILHDAGTKVVFRSKGVYLRGSSGGTTNVDRSGADARVDYALSPRLAAFGMTTYARDTFKAIDYLVAPTGGLAYKVVATASTEWTTDGSVGVVFEKDHDRDLDTSGAFIAGERLTHKFNDRTKFLHAATGLWKMKDFDDAFYTLSAGIVTAVANHFDLKAEFLDSYKRRPSNPALKKNDQSVVMAIVFKY